MENIIGNEIKAALDKSGLPQVLFARLIGVTQQHVSQLVTGRVQPSPAVMKALDETGLMSRKFSVERVLRNGWLDIRGLSEEQLATVVDLVAGMREEVANHDH